MSDNAFVHVRDLRVVFRRDGQTINAVNGVSFDVQKGEVMALIGESAPHEDRLHNGRAAEKTADGEHQKRNDRH